MNNSTLTHEIILPSRGYLNPEIPEGKVVQRCMMVYDQKYLAGSSSADGGLQRLLQETTVSPEKLDVNKLSIPDTMYMLFSLRILSYGNDFKFSTRCPACGKKLDVTVDLSALEVYDLAEDYEENLIVVLPRCKDKVHTRVLTNADYQSVATEFEKMRSKSNDTDGYDYILRLCKLITKVELKEPDADGEKVLTDPVDIRKYVEKMTDYDATAILSTVDSISYGISDVTEYTCYHCNRIVEIPLQFDPSFFRPKYDIPSKRSRR